MSDAAPKRGRGRPSKKSKVVVEKIMQLARAGKTERQIAEIIGVNAATITHWKAKDFEFFASLQENKQVADVVVEGSLFKSATGFHYHEEAPSPDGGVVRVEKFQPPNAAAQIFWLKNRRPKDWRDRREELHKVLMVKQEIVGALPTQQLVAETQRLLEKINAGSGENGSDPTDTE